MVKFEFTLSDEDAENLIDLIHDEKVRTLELARQAVSENYRNWHEGRVEYLENLKQKVLAGNTSVK